MAIYHKAVVAYQKKNKKKREITIFYLIRSPDDVADHDANPTAHLHLNLFPKITSRSLGDQEVDVRRGKLNRRHALLCYRNGTH